MSDYGPLLYPPKKPWLPVSVIGFLSWALPAVAATLAIIGGIEAMRNASVWAAWLSITGGIASAFGVIFTNWASHIRDGQLAVVRSTAQLAAAMADNVSRNQPM